MADPILKWQVRAGDGTAAIQTYTSGQGPISSPISVDEAGWKAAGGPQSVVYYNGKYITTGVYRVVGVSDPSLVIKPGDMVASILGWPFPYADQIGLKSPSQYTNNFWQLVVAANQNPNLPPGPGNDPNTPPGNQPSGGQQNQPLPPGAVGWDQYGRPVDAYGRLVVPQGNYYTPPPAPPVQAPGLHIDPNLLLLLGQQQSQADAARAAREDAADERAARQERQDRADREAARQRAELDRQQLALQREQIRAQQAQYAPPQYAPGVVISPRGGDYSDDDRPRRRRRRRRYY